jgi:hypothetical protein
VLLAEILGTLRDSEYFGEKALSVVGFGSSETLQYTFDSVRLWEIIGGYFVDER